MFQMLKTMTRKPPGLTTLHHVPLFARCSGRELARIAKASDHVTFKAGCTLIERGQPGRELFIITKGIASVRRADATIARVGAGQVVGEIALLDDGLRTASVVCDTDVEAVVINQRNLQEVLDDVPSIARVLLSTLAARTRELNAAS